MSKLQNKCLNLTVHTFRLTRDETNENQHNSDHCRYNGAKYCVVFQPPSPPILQHKSHCKFPRCTDASISIRRGHTEAIHFYFQNANYGAQQQLWILNQLKSNCCNTLLSISTWCGGEILTAGFSSKVIAC